jgi:hypothetical protein
MANRREGVAYGLWIEKIVAPKPSQAVLGQLLSRAIAISDAQDVASGSRLMGFIKIKMACWEERATVGHAFV